MNALAQRKEEFHSNRYKYSQLRTFYDEKYKIGWFLMKGMPRPCFTKTLLGDIKTYFEFIKEDIAHHGNNKYDYIVLGSEVDGVFNLGGDLDLFSKMIQQGNRAGLLDYAVNCIDVLYDNMVHLDSEVTTISLVKGDALGGGFEAALSSNLIIAERGTKLGLPEVLFNLFPGMGAYSLLSRKVGATVAEKMILSGKLYTAEELFEMGVVDMLAEKDEAELVLYKYIKNVNRTPNSYKAMAKVKDLCHQVNYQELLDITNIWVDAALQLTAKDLKMMGRLVKRQNDK
jgi:DSF synthase